jgi:FkbM family methyltransferase
MLKRLTRNRTSTVAAGIARRLEEAIAYFAGRSNPFHYTATAYLGDNTILALLHGRIMMYLDTRGTDLAPHIMMFGIWEPNYTQLFQRLIRPGDTVFDIGAHLGVYALLGSVSAGVTGQVHAFEPNPRFASLLTRSLTVNGFNGFAKVHNLAVGAAEGRTELRFSWEFSGGGHLATTQAHAAPGVETVPCRIAALDDLFADPAFTVDVIKMDVEGTETEAVRGMARLLGRSPRVRILFEFAPGLQQAHGSSAAELIALLAGMGFSFWTVGADSGITPVPAADLAARTDGIVNILAARSDPFAA